MGSGRHSLAGSVANLRNDGVIQRGQALVCSSIIEGTAIKQYAEFDTLMGFCRSVTPRVAVAAGTAESAFLGLPLEQDHCGIKGRIRCLPGCKEHDGAQFDWDHLGRQPIVEGTMFSAIRHAALALGMKFFVPITANATELHFPFLGLPQ
jgi:hypothetical protein